ncbi:hypothetical protein ACFFUO_14635 [Vibrio artabrorum]|uniref:Uncharacterized protein n=1 Tax=Vibrio artabrorum TaxID=446374 RepID=A0ABT8CI19_9VIBR|nr:hypothetical protein [Vibrio artabrorum]MDN3700396.1 hypothetical protein [Vibrio artabrorum]
MIRQKIAGVWQLLSKAIKVIADTDIMESEVHPILLRADTAVTSIDNFSDR